MFHSVSDILSQQLSSGGLNGQENTIAPWKDVVAILVVDLHLAVAHAYLHCLRSLSEEYPVVKLSADAPDYPLDMTEINDHAIVTQLGCYLYRDRIVVSVQRF